MFSKIKIAFIQADNSLTLTLSTKCNSYCLKCLCLWRESTEVLQETAPITESDARMGNEVNTLQESQPCYGRCASALGHTCSLTIQCAFLQNCIIHTKGKNTFCIPNGTQLLLGPVGKRERMPVLLLPFSYIEIIPRREWQLTSMPRENQKVSAGQSRSQTLHT